MSGKVLEQQRWDTVLLLLEVGAVDRPSGVNDVADPNQMMEGLRGKEKKQRHAQFRLLCRADSYWSMRRMVERIVPGDNRQSV